jgi:hypothetical protein
MSIREAICHLAQEEEREKHPGAAPGGRIAPGVLRPALVPIESLAPNPDNPIEHVEKNLEAIKASLQRFGQLKPVVVRKEDNTILCGHAVTQAARELGWSEVAAVLVDHLGAQEAAAFALTDNKTASLADFKYELVSRIIMAEQKSGQAPIGWTQDDIEVLTTFDWTPPKPTGADFGKDAPKVSLKLLGEDASLFRRAAELARQRSDTELSDAEALMMILRAWVEGATGSEDE